MFASLTLLSFFATSNYQLLVLSLLCRCDINDTTFSPPSHDDSFFYIPYPKTQNRSSVSQEYRPIDEVFGKQNITSSTNNVKVQDTQQQFTEEKKKNQEIDFSKHPLPCQPFIPSTSTANKGNLQLTVACVFCAASNYTNFPLIITTETTINK